MPRIRLCNRPCIFKCEQLLGCCLWLLQAVRTGSAKISHHGHTHQAAQSPATHTQCLEVVGLNKLVAQGIVECIRNTCLLINSFKPTCKPAPVFCMGREHRSICKLVLSTSSFNQCNPSNITEYHGNMLSYRHASPEKVTSS